VTSTDGFAPLHRIDGYLPIEDHGLIGDGAAAALVGRDGAVSWLCAPRLDDPPIFCSLLDRRRGGAFRLGPADPVAGRQRYEPDTGVLTTELRAADGGVVAVTDCLTLRSGADLTEDVPAGRGELLRTIVGVEGSVVVEAELAPRGGAVAERRAGGLRVRVAGRSDLDLQLSGSVPLDGLRTRFEVRAGERRHLLLRWGGSSYRRRDVAPDALLRQTLEAWRRWARCIAYDGPEAPLVRRSAVTLKLLDHLGTGALVAAPTSSLPEALGGERNWDYRYAWVRDAAFSVYALRQVGLEAEATGFLGWVLDAIDRDGEPRVLYTIDGAQPPPERVDEGLEGYRRSAPVRWGNAAADQRQHDALGEILDCAWQWASAGGSVEGVWPRLADLVAEAGRAWDQPDQGIWEVRSSGRPFTYSAAMCHVALDRGARLVERFGVAGDAAGWRREADRIRSVILERAWNAAEQSFTEHLDGTGGIDASLLALPLRLVVDARHPRMVATTEAVVRRLGAGGGLVHRYLPDESPDGLAGDEGAFLLCSFWLVDNLAAQGRLDEAGELYESLCGRASPLGLLPEEIDPTTGAFLGNHPQAFSHVGVISSGVNLAQAMAAR
jgi:GH15 family glucan-1,4-alpha-glucosidase